MGILYKLDFPNGKSYIGITTRTLQVRMSAHRYSAFVRNTKYAVYAAWRKYGEPCALILAEHEDWKILCEMEYAAIVSHGTFYPSGYNLTHGGEGTVGHILSEENKESLRKARLGKKLSSETRKKLAIANLGRTHTEETKRKMSAAKKGKKGVLPSPETREKLSKAKAGKKRTFTPEHCANISAAKKASFAERRLRGNP